MNITLKNKFFVLFFWICVYTIKAQVNLDFSKHLKANNLNTEYFSYINSIKTNDDTLNFLLIDYYMLINNPDSVYKIQNKKFSFLNDTLIRCEISKFWLKQNNHKNFYNWFDSVLKTPLSVCDKEMLVVVNRSKLNYIKESALMDKYNSSYYTLVKTNFKKPFKAAILSTFVPGLGRWYNGKPKLFLINLISIAGYGLQTAESIKKYGTKNPYSIFMMSFGGLFYISNIYGSFYEAKIMKKEKKLIYFNEANLFYNNYFNFK